MHGRARRPHRARPSRARPRGSSVRRSAGSSRLPRRIRSSRRTRTSGSCRTSSRRRRTGSPSRGRSTTTPCSRTTPRSRPFPASSWQGRSASARGTSSRSRKGRGRRRASRSRVAYLAAAVAAALVVAGEATAQSFTLPSADVVVQVAQDGSLIVDEVISFEFSGDFSGAFREIPLREGETILEVGVSEGEIAYKPGASAELGSAGAPGTFGTTQTDKGLRVVWHYQASNELRSFRVHYRLRGVATAHDDVVDVNLKIWGEEW